MQYFLINQPRLYPHRVNFQIGVCNLYHAEAEIISEYGLIFWLSLGILSSSG